MFFFVGWPKVVPLKHSEVVDIQHNGSKVWTVILTKDRISVWTFALNQNILRYFGTKILAMCLIQYDRTRKKMAGHP